MLTIRKATKEDLPFIMEIYKRARQFMAETGNPNQWGNTKPYEEWIKRDIEVGKSYVCVKRLRDEETEKSEEDCGTKKEIIAAVFYFSVEEDPTYKIIYEGQWLNDYPYGVVHRIASAGTVKGAGEFCLKWAIAQNGNLRIDTHEDNLVMQNLLKKIGFQYCGIIHLENGDARMAFQCEKMK